MPDVCCPLVRQMGATLDVGVDGWASNCRVGPFMTTLDASCDFSDQFAGIFRDKSNDHRMNAWASLDMGVTWAKVDVSGFAALSHTIIAFDCHQEGNTIHVVTREGTSQRVAYHTFDLVTQTWTKYNELVSDGSDSSAMNDTAQIVSICTRSDGVVCIAYSISAEFALSDWRARNSLKYRTGGAWSASIGIGRIGPTEQGSTLYHIVPGASARLHCFFGKTPGGVASAVDDDVQTIGSDFSIGTVHTWLTHGISGYLNPGRYGLYSDLSKFIWPGRNGGSGEYYVFTSSADITTYTSTTAIGEIVQQGGAGSGLASMIASRVHGADRVAYIDWSIALANLWVRVDPIGSDTKFSPIISSSNNLQELDGQFLYLNNGTVSHVWAFVFLGIYNGDKTLFLLLDLSNLGTIATTPIATYVANLSQLDPDYTQECSGCTVAIPPGSSYEADSFIGDVSAPVAVPSLFTLELADVKSVSLLPPPDSDGRLEYVYVPYPTALPSTPDGTVLNVPDDLTPFVKYGALADLFGKAGEQSDPVRRDFCEQLFNLGADVAKSWVATD